MDMNKTEHVATFTRETDTNEFYGCDKSAKIYKVIHPNGTVSFAVSLFENTALMNCQGDYIAYGYAMKVAIEWLDNSDFYL